MINMNFHFMKWLQILKIYNFTNNDLSTKVNKDTGLYEFKNINITNLWKSYHYQNASLQLISKEANLSNKY